MWVALFTCLVVRTIHLECVCDLSASPFLNCLLQFVARPGVPEYVVLGNAPTFTWLRTPLTSHDLRLPRIRNVQSFFFVGSPRQRKIDMLLHLSYNEFPLTLGFPYRSLSTGSGVAVTIGSPPYANQPSHDTHTVQRHRHVDHAESISKSEKTCMKLAENAQNKRTANEVESLKLRIFQTKDGLFFYISRSRVFHAQCMYMLATSPTSLNIIAFPSKNSVKTKAIRRSFQPQWFALV